MCIGAVAPDADDDENKYCRLDTFSFSPFMFVCNFQTKFAYLIKFIYFFARKIDNSHYLMRFSSNLSNWKGTTSAAAKHLSLSMRERHTYRQGEQNYGFMCR